MRSAGCRWRLCWVLAGVTVLYLALNVVYGLALSAADVRAIVDDPVQRHRPRRRRTDCTDRRGAIVRARMVDAFSIAFGTMLLSTLSAYVLIGPRVVYAMAKAGQFPSIAARLSRGCGHACCRDGASNGSGVVSALDRFVRESDHLRGCWTFDLLVAGGELDLRPALEAAGHGPAIPDTRISGDSRGFLGCDRTSDGRDGPRAPAGFALRGSQHRGRGAVLLHLAGQGPIS